VKICTLYGDGFYYIPGSDTCIRFSGYVRADYGFNVAGARTPHYSGVNGTQTREVSRFSTRHRGSFAVDTRTQTAYGTLRTYQQIHASQENEGSDAVVNLSRAFIQWGGFTFGRTVSFIDHEGSIGDSGMRSLHQPQQDSTSGANGTNQIAYTWQLGNGVSLNVGADERRVRALSNLSSTSIGVGSDPGSSRHGTSHMNPWVSLRMSQAWGRASVAVIANKNDASYFTANTPGFTQCTGGNTGSTFCGYPEEEWGWAVLAGAEIKLDMLSPGSRFGVFTTHGVGATRYVASNLASPGLYGSGNQLAFGTVTDGVYRNGTQIELTTAWSAGGGFEYFWTRNFSSTIYGAYTEVSYNDTVINGNWFCGANVTFTGAGAGGCNPGFVMWSVGSHHDWFPLPGLRLAVDVLYTQIESEVEGTNVTLNRNGARPAGVYAVSDQGITSVIFRAQRSWGAN